MLGNTGCVRAPYNLVIRRSLGMTLLKAWLMIIGLLNRCR